MVPVSLLSAPPATSAPRAPSSPLEGTARSRRTDGIVADLRRVQPKSSDSRGLTVTLIETNAGVARSMASRYRNRGIDLDDLEQVALLGLTKAAQRFDPGAGHDFLSYAVPTVRGELRRHFRDAGWMIRPPRRVQDLQGRISRAQHELEASLREVEALIATLQAEADATRAVASGLLSGSGALDEALGVFDLFDAPASALPTPPTPAPNVVRPGEPYAPPYAAVQGWLERQLEHDYIAGLALFTENADTLTAGVLPTAAKTLGRAVRLARRRANALGERLAQGSAASLAVETQGYTMLVFWPTRTRSLALITHAPTWRGAARQTVEDALPELTALLQAPVPN